MHTKLLCYEYFNGNLVFWGGFQDMTFQISLCRKISGDKLFTFIWNLYEFFFVSIWPLLPSLHFSCRIFLTHFSGVAWLCLHCTLGYPAQLSFGYPEKSLEVRFSNWLEVGWKTKHGHVLGWGIWLRKSPIRSSIACSPQATKKPQPGCDLNSSKTGFRSSSSSSASARALSAWLSYQDDPSQTWIKPMCHVHKHVDTC